MKKPNLEEKYPPLLWRIDGKTVLQKFEPFELDGKIFYRNKATVNLTINIKYIFYLSINYILYYYLSINCIAYIQYINIYNIYFHYFFYSTLDFAPKIVT